MRALAVAQTIPRAGDVPANLEQHLGLARLAAGEGARVVVFPELSLTGYELDRAEELSFTPEDPRLASLREVAAEGETTLIVGAPVLAHSGLHLAAFVIGPDGELALYAKQRLGAFPPEANPGGAVPPPEGSVFVTGPHDPRVRLDGHTAAVAICADTGNPDHPAAAADRGASTYLASMFLIPGDYPAETLRLGTHARRHGLTVAMANYGGPTGGLPSAGRSAIWSGAGELLVELPTEGAGVAIALEGVAGWTTRVLPVRGA